jgi:hypothetical protein
MQSIIQSSPNNPLNNKQRSNQKLDDSITQLLDELGFETNPEYVNYDPARMAYAIAKLDKKAKNKSRSFFKRSRNTKPKEAKKITSELSYQLENIENSEEKNNLKSEWAAITKKFYKDFEPKQEQSMVSRIGNSASDIAYLFGFESVATALYFADSAAESSNNNQNYTEKLQKKEEFNDLANASIENIVPYDLTNINTAEENPINRIPSNQIGL